MVGRPVVQTRDGEVMVEVTDTGVPKRIGVRGFRTNVAQPPHVDNSFNQTPPDHVSLLCLRAARDGGASRFVSFCSVHNVLLAEHPEALERLYRPFYQDRQGDFWPDEPQTVFFPVFDVRPGPGPDLRCRYTHFTIPAGYETAGVEMDGGDTRRLRDDDPGGGGSRPVLRVHPSAGRAPVREQPLVRPRAGVLHRPPGARAKAPHAEALAPRRRRAPLPRLNHFRAPNGRTVPFVSDESTWDGRPRPRPFRPGPPGSRNPRGVESNVRERSRRDSRRARGRGRRSAAAPRRVCGFSQRARKCRPMSWRWTWFVPSQIWVILASRISRSTR